jgi:WD40 repeat protein
MIRGLAYNPAKRILATGSWDNTAKVMKLGTGPSPKLELKLTLAGHSKRLNSVVFNTTGTTLLTGSMDQLIKYVLTFVVAS